MRISDWSSDVCSSDLRALQLSRQPWRAPKVGSALLDKMTYDALAKITYRDNKTLWREYEDTSGVRFFPLSMYARRAVDIFVIEKRLEERRVGKECVRTGRSRWSPYQSKIQEIAQSRD